MIEGKVLMVRRLAIHLLFFATGLSDIDYWFDGDRRKRYEDLVFEVCATVLQEKTRTVSAPGVRWLAAAAICLLQLTACGPEVQIQEISRVHSASKKLDAVLYTSDAGATTSTGYHVAVVPTDQPPDYSGDVFVSDRVLAPEEFHVEFREDRLLITHPGREQLIRSVSKINIGGEEVVVQFETVR